MKKIVPVLVCMLFAHFAFAQDFKGQWKGQFIDNSTTFMGWGGDRCDYVLELEANGNNVTGYSYTYFNDGGKRFYTICRLQGKLDKRSHSIQVTEIERTKTNVPNHIRNCFQIHKLTYFKQGDTETLEGSWSPAPNQEGDCGYGTTSLSRRVLKRDFPVFNKATARTVKPTQKPVAKATPNFADKNKPANPPVAKNNTKPVFTPPSVKRPKVELDTNASPIAKVPEIKERTDIGFEKRNNTLIRTIEVENETFKVDLYDNGTVDGDSISLFFNGRLILSHRRLSEKAISLTLSTDSKKDVNELIMYAENLGEIPPNTALMVVTDGDHRYEVRITSDLEKSGAIRFIHKQKTAQ